MPRDSENCTKGGMTFRGTNVFSWKSPTKSHIGGIYDFSWDLLSFPFSMWNSRNWSHEKSDRPFSCDHLSSLLPGAPGEIPRIVYFKMVSREHKTILRGIIDQNFLIGSYTGITCLRRLPNSIYRVHPIGLRLGFGLGCWRTTMANGGCS